MSGIASPVRSGIEATHGAADVPRNGLGRSPGMPDSSLNAPPEEYAVRMKTLVDGMGICTSLASNKYD
jgi:hypothetical protein